MNNEKKYFAFISYKREDEKWAKWLQNKLEHYKLPSNLNGRTDLPKEIRPIFRDQSELAAGVLADEINKALTNSKYLIVICSPRAAQSVWVGKEVQTFIDLGRTDKIIPFIIGGTAHAQNPENECFPLALLNLPPELELLGINIDEMGRDAAAVKVVAQMFGLKFDTLWKRYERGKKRKNGIFVAIAIFALGIAGWIWLQNVKLKQKDWKLMENQARFVGEKANSIAYDDSYLARMLAVKVLPENLDDPDRPYTPEADAALRNASNHNTAILRGHDSPVISVKFSPDGKRIVSAAGDGVIMLWDAETGDSINIMANHTAAAQSAEFSPDGKLIVSASQDSTILIWNVNEKRVARIKGFFGCVNYASFSPDGKQIVSASNDTIKFWDVETCALKKTMTGHRSVIRRVSFSPDGELVVSASSDSTVRIWDVESGDLIRVLRGHHDFVNSAEFSPDGNLVVSASDDNTVKIWDVASGAPIKTFEHNSDVLSASFNFNGRCVVSSSLDKKLIIWDVETYIPIHTIEEQSPALSVSYSPDGKKIVYTILDETYLKLWGEDASDHVRTIVGHEDIVFSLAFSPDGRYLVSASEDQAIVIWDLNSGEKVNSLVRASKPVGLLNPKNGKSYPIVSYSPNGELIAASLDGKIVIWDSKTMNRIKVLTGDVFDGVNYLYFDRKIDFSPDGKKIVTTSNFNNVIVLNVASETKQTMTGHKGYVNHVAFSPDGTRIISTSYDKRVIIWNAKTGKLNQIIELKDEGYAHAASFSADGRRVVISTDENASVWDVSNNKEPLMILHGFRYATYDPMGRYIVAVSKDAIKIVDSQSGMTIRTIAVDGEEIVSISHGGRYLPSKVYDPQTGEIIRNNPDVISISHDGNYIAISMRDKISIYAIPNLQDLIDQTRERFKDRPLTPEERHQYYLE